MKLQNFDPQEFLNNHWQQRPLYIPSMVTGTELIISADELAGLACEPQVESRLVDYQPAEKNWRLRHGPFDEADFQLMTDNNWTLLVQAVDLWQSESADLKRLFDFIPSWRIDDVMVSYAVDGGGVGPHFDNYDVFLVQGAGSRRWQLGQYCHEGSEFRNDSELRILSKFQSRQEYLLNPGDVLYIPPQYAHFGTSIGESLCYSIGFRSPSVAEQLQGFTDLLMDKVSDQERFIDSSPQVKNSIGEISSDILHAPLQKLRNLLDDEKIFATWFGCHVTMPKYAEFDHCPDEILDAAKLSMLTAPLVKNPAARFAYINLHEVTLFVDGIDYQLHPEQLDVAQQLCQQETFNIAQVKQLCEAENIQSLLLELLNNGSLLCS